MHHHHYTIIIIIIIITRCPEIAKGENIGVAQLANVALELVERPLEHTQDGLRLRAQLLERARAAGLG